MHLVLHLGLLGLSHLFFLYFFKHLHRNIIIIINKNVIHISIITVAPFISLAVRTAISAGKNPHMNQTMSSPKPYLAATVLNKLTLRLPLHFSNLVAGWGGGWTPIQPPLIIWGQGGVED